MRGAHVQAFGENRRSGRPTDCCRREEMKKLPSMLICSALTTAMLAGCADNGTGGGMNKTTSGALIGAGTGAALGGIFGHGSAGAIAAGGLVGGLLGGVI